MKKEIKNFNELANALLVFDKMKKTEKLEFWREVAAFVCNKFKIANTELIFHADHGTRGSVKTESRNVLVYEKYALNNPAAMLYSIAHEHAHIFQFDKILSKPYSSLSEDDKKIYKSILFYFPQIPLMPNATSEEKFTNLATRYLYSQTATEIDANKKAEQFVNKILKELYKVNDEHFATSFLIIASKEDFKIKKMHKDWKLINNLIKSTDAEKVIKHKEFLKNQITSTLQKAAENIEYCPDFLKAVEYMEIVCAVGFDRKTFVDLFAKAGYGNLALTILHHHNILDSQEAMDALRTSRDAEAYFNFFKITQNEERQIECLENMFTTKDAIKIGYKFLTDPALAPMHEKAADAFIKTNKNFATYFLNAKLQGLPKKELDKIPECIIKKFEKACTSVNEKTVKKS